LTGGIASRSSRHRLDVIHALAAGAPVIAAEGGATTEIIQPGVNGFLASGEEALTAAIAALDKLNPHDCKETAAKRHSLGAAVERYETIYHRVAGHRDRHRPQLTGRESRSHKTTDKIRRRHDQLRA
jgi:glycosyltransferase involved in cell wall biosynthesis